MPCTVISQDLLSKILSCPAAVQIKGLYSNKNKVTMTPRCGGLTPRQSRRISQNIQGPGPLLITNVAEKKELSFYGLLFTDLGIKNCQKFFNQITNNEGFTEAQFTIFMHELTDMGDPQIVTVFDIFDTQHKGILDFTSFFILFSLYCGLESGQTLLFLYQHYEILFEIIHHGKDELSWGDFAKFGYIIGLSEKELFSRLAFFNIDIFETITKEEFVMYYYVILKNIDDVRKELVTTVSDTENESEQDDKNKDCIIS
eukprot:TRINITY_DN2472_c0_g1_i1.p1 TRINITY_DN2472_c0_g1~~TRINITY_DN2472_c0_g1_i1.p1  ORF type:complete len:257 (-),score=58.72 TRINITY_DN2472_c0_g1_i1:105-875(-)